MHISQRASTMNYSPIRKLIPLADAAKAEGVTVYALNIGQPNIVTPDTFFTALHSFSDKIVKYSDSRGLEKLRESFKASYEKMGTFFDKEEILITQGGSEAIFFTMMAICNEGDNVLIPEPFYSNYSSFCKFAGAIVKPIETTIETKFHLPSREVIESLIDEKTRAIMISNPVNPTGAVYTKEEIYMLGEIAEKYDIYIIADEVYKQFIYDDVEYFSFTHIPEIEDRVVLVDSISKHYSACGARIGLIATKNQELLKEILKFCQARLCVSTIEQHAASNLINTMESYVEDVREKYKNRRDLLFNYLDKMPGVVCSKPCGAFYAFAKLPVDSSEKFAKWLLKEYRYNNQTILLAPGPGFYQTEGKGEQEVRFSFCTNVDDIENAMIILRRALKVYRKDVMGLIEK